MEGSKCFTPNSKLGVKILRILFEYCHEYYLNRFWGVRGVKHIWRYFNHHLLSILSYTLRTEMLRFKPKLLHVNIIYKIQVDNYKPPVYTSCFQACSSVLTEHRFGKTVTQSSTIKWLLHKEGTNTSTFTGVINRSLKNRFPKIFIPISDFESSWYQDGTIREWKESVVIVE